MGKPVKVRFVGSKKVLMVKLEPGAKLKDLRESLKLSKEAHHIALARTGEFLPEDADLHRTLSPGEELFVSPRAELG
jgi:hypothetical protein